jgi:SepF-like predicted cell division protein (DUF552 family)
MSKLSEALGKVFGRSKKPESSVAEGEEAKPGIPAAAVPEKVYLKALPLRDLEDVEMIKQEVKSGNVLILKVSPLAKKSIDDVKTAVGQLMEFTQSVGGDIARLGEERVVITPAFIRIWREKATATGGALPTAA